MCQPQALIEAKWVTQLLASHSNLEFSDIPIHQVCWLATGNPRLVGTYGRRHRSVASPATAPHFRGCWAYPPPGTPSRTGRTVVSQRRDTPSRSPRDTEAPRLNSSTVGRNGKRRRTGRAANAHAKHGSTRISTARYLRLTSASHVLRKPPVVVFMTLFPHVPDSD